MREVALYGTQVIKVTGSYDQAREVAVEFAKQRGIYIDLGARSIPGVESMKTIAFEIAEQLTALIGPPQPENNEKSGRHVAFPRLVHSICEWRYWANGCHQRV